MKKASIIFSIISLLFLGCTYYFMQKSAHLITESEQVAENMAEIMRSDRIEYKKNAPDFEDDYHYEDMELKQEDHIIINNCMQFYINEKSFENADRCEETIVDEILENMGEKGFINGIFGIMVHYKNEVFIKPDFPQILFETGTSEKSLKSKLILTFLNRYRDPVKLQTEFDNYKDYFFDSISENLYKKLFSKYLNSFIDSYEKINQEIDKEAFFKKIYYEAETKNRHNKFWNYTFWKRRELEKNDQIIYSILKEIKTHYEM